MKKAKDIPIGGLFADQVGNRTKRFAIPLPKGEAAELSKALAKVGEEGRSTRGLPTPDQRLGGGLKLKSELRGNRHMNLDILAAARRPALPRRVRRGQAV